MVTAVKSRRRAPSPVQPRQEVHVMASSGTLKLRMAVLLCLGLASANARLMDIAFTTDVSAKPAARQSHRQVAEVNNQPTLPPPQPPTTPLPPSPPAPPPLVPSYSTPPPSYGGPPDTPSATPAPPVYPSLTAPPSTPAPPPSPPAPPTSPAPPAYPPASPPPPGVTQLPPLDSSLVMISTNTSDDTTAVSGQGLVRVRPAGANAAEWNYLCGDPWAGWDSAAANAACRQAGYSAGGEALRVWRSGDLPLMLLGKLNCQGSETSLSACPMAAVVNKVDAWNFDVDTYTSSDVCTMVAAVKCRSGGSGASTALRAASSPSPSATVTTINGASYYLARIESSLSSNSAKFGAVCLDSGFNNAAASVACRSLGYTAGGSVYTSGTTRLAPNSADAAIDAEGSFLGTMMGVRCSGSESSLSDCASWRAATSADVVPCRAAAWVACARSVA